MTTPKTPSELLASLALPDPAREADEIADTRDRAIAALLRERAARARLSACRAAIFAAQDAWDAAGDDWARETDRLAKLLGRNAIDVRQELAICDEAAPTVVRQAGEGFYLMNPDNNDVRVFPSRVEAQEWIDGQPDGRLRFVVERARAAADAVLALAAGAGQ